MHEYVYLYVYADVGEEYMCMYMQLYTNILVYTYRSMCCTHECIYRRKCMCSMHIHINGYMCTGVWT